MNLVLWVIVTIVCSVSAILNNGFSEPDKKYFSTNYPPASEGGDKYSTGNSQDSLDLKVTPKSLDFIPEQKNDIASTVKNKITSGYYVNNTVFATLAENTEESFVGNHTQSSKNDNQDESTNAPSKYKEDTSPKSEKLNTPINNEENVMSNEIVNVTTKENNENKTASTVSSSTNEETPSTYEHGSSFFPTSTSKETAENTKSTLSTTGETDSTNEYTTKENISPTEQNLTFSTENTSSITTEYTTTSPESPSTPESTSAIATSTIKGTENTSATSISLESSLSTESTTLSTDETNTSTEPSTSSFSPETTSGIDIPTTEQAFPMDCSDIPEVSFTDVTVMDFNVTLEWSVSANIECIVYYTIYLTDLSDEQRNKNITTSELSLTIDDLYSCSDYYIAIVPFGNTTSGPTTTTSIQTPVPQNFSSYGVQSLTIEPASNVDLNVEWDPPEAEVLRCVTDYYMIWWDDNDNSISLGEKTVDGTELNTTIPIIGCLEYVLQIYPRANESNSGKLIFGNYSAGPYPAKPPEILKGSIHTGKSFTNVTWSTNDKKENKCKLYQILVTCVAPTDINCDTCSWVIWNGHAEEEIIDNKTWYTMSVSNLSPFTTYSCDGVVLNSAGNSSATNFLIRTDEEVPPMPKSITFSDITDRNFTIQWEQLKDFPGSLKSYGLRVEGEGPAQIPHQDCMENFTISYFYVVGPDKTDYVFNNTTPYYKYTISLYGTDGAGDGPVATANVISGSAEPDSVVNVQADPPKYSTNDTYSAVVTVKFDPPCNVNGPFKYYQAFYEGVREGLDNHEGNITTNEPTVNVDLLPDRNYAIAIVVVNDHFTSANVSVPPFHSQPGVPIFVGNMSAPELNEDGTTAVFELKKSYFDLTNGDIMAFSLFLLTSEEAGSYGFWNGSDETWPAGPKTANQLTPNLWNPFQGNTSTIKFTIGEDSDCKGKSNCNGPLKAGTKYWLLVRLLTSATYKDTPLLQFHKGMSPDSQLALILGLTLGLLALLTLTGFIIFLWRRKRKPLVRKEVSVSKRRSTAAAPISVHKFLTYYSSIKANADTISQQFTELGVQGKAIAGMVSFAVLPENKRKNRYTNILPFDATRVTLKIDEDDEICSDYINASYVKGYSGKVEYIASQGPLESTARDFWKMVLQENVSIIAMVSQFIEQSKEKCFQYFPNNHESVQFGESLEVKCSTELHFGTYCVRTLQVRKGTEQRDVVHMQFLEWPDFGVPQGTDNMLQFCSQLREKANREGGLIVVHCSAGVGRTGTLIALDILFQTIDDHRDINIYKTVLDLRRQRTNMVQTEKQYMFIHTCVKDYLEAPPTHLNDTPTERIYENLDIMKSSLKKNLIESELESAL